MKKLLLLFQVLLKCGLIFLIAFIWLRYFLHSLWLSFIIATALTIIVELASCLYMRKNKNKMNLKIKEREDAENMFFSLISVNNGIEFFEKLAQTRHSIVIRKKDYLIIKTNEKEKVLLYPFLKLDALTPQNIVNIKKISQKEQPDKIIISCYDYTKDCPIFIKNFNDSILLLNKDETYAFLFKEYQYFPEITMQYKKTSNLSLKDLIAYSFNRSRTKGYIFSAIILFITSFFVHINIYYCIIATILLLFALISYINPKYNKRINTELL